jgi:hypothetical protein
LRKAVAHQSVVISRPMPTFPEASQVAGELLFDPLLFARDPLNSFAVPVLALLDGSSEPVNPGNNGLPCCWPKSAERTENACLA